MILYKSRKTIASFKLCPVPLSFPDYILNTIKRRILQIWSLFYMIIKEIENSQVCNIRFRIPICVINKSVERLINPLPEHNLRYSPESMNSKND